MIRQIKLAITLALCALLAACGGVNLTWDENYSYLTITLSEAQVNDILTSALARSDLRNVQTDLYDTGIYVSADLVRDGQTTPGDLDIYVGTANGLLDIEVLSFNFAGFNADGAMLDRINRDIADGITRDAQNNESNSEFTQVTINETQLSFTIRTPREQ
jgi:hypothetical protein